MRTDDERRRRVIHLADFYDVPLETRVDPPINHASTDGRRMPTP